MTQFSYNKSLLKTYTEQKNFMTLSLNQYLLRVGLFLALVFIIVVLLYPVLQDAFLSNIFINLIILAALAIGIIFSLFKLVGLNSDYIALANFDINKSPQSFLNNKRNLKNIKVFYKSLQSTCSILANQRVERGRGACFDIRYKRKEDL